MPSLTSLPAEILLRIIKLACSERNSGRYPFSTEVLETVGNIHQQFGALIAANPFLFAELSSVQTNKDFLCKFTASGGCPLTICIYNEGARTHAVTAQRVLAMATQNARWRTVSVIGAYLGHFLMPWHRLDIFDRVHSFPNVESLTVCGLNSSEWALDACTFPALKNIRIVDEKFTAVARFMTMTITTCTILLFDDDSRRYFRAGSGDALLDGLRALSHCCNLQELNLSFETSSVPEHRLPLSAIDFQKVSFPSLTHLLVSVRHEFPEKNAIDNNHLVLLCIDAPSLQSIRARYLPNRHGWPLKLPVEPVFIRRHDTQAMTFLRSIAGIQCAHTLVKLRVRYDGEEGYTDPERWNNFHILLCEFTALRHLDVGGSGVDLVTCGQAPNDVHTGELPAIEILVLRRQAVTITFLTRLRTLFSNAAGACTIRRLYVDSNQAPPGDEDYKSRLARAIANFCLTSTI